VVEHTLEQETEMKLTRPIIATAVALTLLTGGIAGTAAEPSSQGAPGATGIAGATRISGIIELGRPIVTLDPLATWRLAAPGVPYRMIEPAHLAAVAPDALASWLIPDRISSGAEQWRGGHFAGSIALDDPRFIGWLSTLWSTDVYPMAGSPASVSTVEVLLQGDAGTWRGEMTGIGDPWRSPFQLHGTLMGSGAYEGTFAVLDIIGTGPDADWSFDGLVIHGSVPPVAGLAWSDTVRAATGAG
jgi:hypothetical protein